MGTTTRTTPFEGDIGDNTKRYLSYGELHERLYLSRTQTFRLEREGARLLPDVIVTPGTLGWDDARVLRYGVETKRLAQDGQPAGGWDGDRPRNRVEDGDAPPGGGEVQRPAARVPGLRALLLPVRAH